MDREAARDEGHPEDHEEGHEDREEGREEVHEVEVREREIREVQAGREVHHDEEAQKVVHRNLPLLRPQLHRRGGQILPIRRGLQRLTRGPGRIPSRRPASHQATCSSAIDM